MQSAQGFEEFVAIVDSGSVTAAADVLGLPRPTVSRRLARLEERLGVRLLHRTTRRMTITPQGEVLYARARRLVEAAHEAASEVRRLDGVPRGLLRVSTPTNLPTVFAGWIAGFLHANPEVSLELVGSNANVDLVAEGFDVAFVRGESEDASLILRTLRMDSSIAVAAPKYLASAGLLEGPDHLADHSCILGYWGRTAPEHRWPLLHGGWVQVAGALKTNQIELRLAAVKFGLGIALVSQNLAAEDLASGALVHVLPEVIGSRERVSLVYADREFLDPKIRAFIDFLVARVEEVSRAR